jgi:hypothetical protein
MRFTVGMIVNVVCEQELTGVIIGWDKYTDVHKLCKYINKQFKLYYIVLCDDDKLHFIPEGIHRLYYINYFILNSL